MDEKFKKIDAKGLDSFISALIEEYTVYAPVKNEGPVEAENEYQFSKIDSPDEAALVHPPVVIPPKKYFFPKKETLFHMKESEIRIPEAGEEFVILGVHPCDINSFLILDKMFGKEPHEDPYYQRRRDNSIVIGIDRDPNEYCFSQSMGKAKAEEGYDLFLTRIPEEDGFIVEIGSEVGESLVSGEEFKSVDKSFAKEIIKESLDWEEEKSVEVEDLSESTRRSFDSEEIWGDLGDRCLGCGNCTMVCPCCNCFDVKDESSLKSSEVTRRRSWNACTLLEFAEVSGGHFRKSVKSRYR
ncbi:MAG: 4Fe-4S dicluster domain-containing protein, partial [Candidatus Hadarchaeia archaeon]